MWAGAFCFTFPPDRWALLAPAGATSPKWGWLRDGLLCQRVFQAGPREIGRGWAVVSGENRQVLTVASVLLNFAGG